MSSGVQGGRVWSLDAAITELGAIAGADEKSEARAAQVRAHDRRQAANVERKKIEEQRRRLNESRVKAEKPGFFARAIGFVGRVFAAVTTSGYSLLLELSERAREKSEGWLGVFGMLMAPLAGMGAMIGERLHQTELADEIASDQRALEVTGSEVERLRRAMVDALEVARTANDRAAAVREAVEEMTSTLDGIGRER